MDALPKMLFLFVQAHMQARYVILRVLLEGAGGLVSLERTTGSNGKPDIVVKLDRTKIETLGKKAIGDFLRKIQVNNAYLSYCMKKES